jgi:hypothetical protein
MAGVWQLFIYAHAPASLLARTLRDSPILLNTVGNITE